MGKSSRRLLTKITKMSSTCLESNFQKMWYVEEKREMRAGKSLDSHVHLLNLGCCSGFG